MKPYKIYDDGVEIEQGALDQFYSAMEQDLVRIDAHITLLLNVKG